MGAGGEVSELFFDKESKSDFCGLGEEEGWGKIDFFWTKSPNLNTLLNYKILPKHFSD